MKKLIPLLLVLALISGAASLVLLRRRPVRHVEEWLPQGTILLDHAPDLHRTAQRWPGTALAQILAEPEVRAFLEKPESLIPGQPELRRRASQWQSIAPSEAFLAVTEWNGTHMPKIVAGVFCTGSSAAMDEAVGEFRKALQDSMPAARANVEKYGAGEVETYTGGPFDIGIALRGRWLFVATDVALLKSTLDRFEQKQGSNSEPSLAELPLFRKCLAHTGADPDNIFFVRPALVAEQVGSLALMLNPMGDSASAIEQLKRMEAVCSTLKLDGPLMRDATYAIRPTNGDSAPLAFNALRLSSTSSMLVAGFRLDLATDGGGFTLPDPKNDPTGALQALETALRRFSDQGLDAARFAKAFGPEGGLLLDWPEGSMIPAPLIMLDVRDAALARKFMDVLPTLDLGGNAFTRQDDDGVTYYSLPQSGIGFFPLQITLGLAPRGVVGSLTYTAVKDAASRLATPAPTLADVSKYKDAATLVQRPGTSFMYLDTRAIFEKLYGVVRGFASMGMIPTLNQYVDIPKLPAPETIGKHLMPMVASGAVHDGGFLEESAGPVTQTQASIITGIGIGAAAVPMFIQRMSGQFGSIPTFQRPVPAAGASPSVPATGGSSPLLPGPAATPAPAESASPSPASR